MALPQPTNVPRIIEVLDPGANQLSVEVRMPPQLASKYPDKAWGTAIDTIGLQKKDSDRFVGYTLVDIQPMRDSDDLKWIFEKLSGPVWTTTTVGSENIIPEKFRSQVSQTKTKQEVAPGTSPSAITGDLISSTVEAQENTGKAVKVDVSETIDAAATALVSPSLEDQLYVTTEILVAEGTLPDTGTGVVESTVQAIGKGKAIKTSKFAVTAYTNKTTYTVGYASLLNENVGSADSIPAKFRALKSLKTWRLRVQASAPPSTPALGVGSGAYSGYDIVERAVKQTQENGSTDVFELVIVGLANTGANSLDSTTYGKIVTTTTTETLDLAAQTIDTGLAVISSTVEELGNGMTLKSTEQVQGGTWPDPVEQEIVSDATKQPPARYLRDLIRTTVKKMVSAVGSGTLTGNQVAKSYKRETPDRVAETVTTEELNLTLTAIDSGVQQKPFVTITEVMTPGPAKVLPTNRSGSAKLVYEQGTNQIWENTEEVAVAREGPAGSDKEAKPFVSIQTDKRYATDPTINTTSGSANLIFNDGTVQAYEVSEVTATAKLGAAGTATDQKPFVTLQTVKTYEATDNLGANEVGATNKNYDDGTTEVYEKSVVNATAREGLKGIETSAQQWGAIKSTTNYTTEAEPPVGGSNQIAFTDGVVDVYEQTTKEVVIRTDEFVSAKEKQPLYLETETTSFSATPVIDKEGRTKRVFSLGEQVVYENIKNELTATGPKKGSETSSFLGGGALEIEEDLVADGAQAESGFLVVKSSVKPFKDGKSVSSKTKIDSYPELTGQSFNNELGINMPFTDKIIDASVTPAAEANVEPIDKWRSKQRTLDKTVIQAALRGIHLIYNSQEHVQLPDVLKSLTVLATRTVGNSNSRAQGLSWGVTNNSSLAVSADIGYEIEEGFNGAVPSEIHVFFLPKDGASAADIRDKVNAVAWPIFRPTSSRLVISGHGVSKELGFRSSENSISQQESSSVQALSNVAVIPPTLHSNMPIDIIYTDLVAPTSILNAEYTARVAKVSAQVTAIKTALNQTPPVFMGKIITDARATHLKALCDMADGVVNFADDLKATDAVVKVEPKTLTATNPPALTPGRYIKNSMVSLYGHDMVKVTAVVVDLTTILPPP